MLCFIYRSTKKEGVYLYIEQEADFSRIPAELMANFGKPVFVMRLALSKTKKLAAVDLHTLQSRLSDQGFYLQVPPPIKNLLTISH